MRKNIPQTPLLALLRVLTREQRMTFAAHANTSVSYLYALASCQRGACRSDLAMQIERASEKMCQETGGLSPIVSMRELASMCAIAP
jgi:hypothetical protein